MGIAEFLEEDVGPGDITSNAIIGTEQALARIVVKEDCILAGLEEAVEVFRSLGLECKVQQKDGNKILKGNEVLRVKGSAKSILAGERLALNFLMRMSGIATMTHNIQDTIKKVNPNCRIAATRKTTPGFRYYEKKAVYLGGGEPHRNGLYDEILIKDNHIKIVGSIEEAIGRAKRNAPGKKIEIEVESPQEAERASGAGADIIMFDNMYTKDIEKAMLHVRKGVMIEVSGNITPERVSDYARYAHLISMGRITHSARAMDFALEILGVEKGL